MSNQTPAGRPKSSNSLIALVVAVAVGVIYFLNTGGLAVLLPDEYNVTLTPTPMVQAEEAAFAQGETGGAQAAAVDAPAAQSTEAPAEEATETPTAAPTMPSEINGLPTIAWDDLPPQAWDTIDAIDQGGPFAYDRDGITFQNREGLLPQERGGFYKEYTVKTPGSSDRGARRIIEGADGVLYYTDDHYDSFSVVVR